MCYRASRTSIIPISNILNSTATMEPCQKRYPSWNRALKIFVCHFCTCSTLVITNFINIFNALLTLKREPQFVDANWRNHKSWWRHQMETFSALLALCAGNSPVNGEFPAQRPVTRSFDVFFNVRLIKRLNKHSRGWWFEALSRPLWRHGNDHKLTVA